MYKGRLICEIDSLNGSFTKSEEIVIDFLKKYFHEVIHLSITEFSDKTGVGETTIVRLCKKLGYKGYHDFKLAIAQDETLRKKEFVDLDTISAKVCKNMITVIEDSKSILDEDLIKTAIKMINSANRIYFYGVGASGVTALEAHSKFFRISPKFIALTDSHFQTMAAKIMTKDDLVIVITISGSTKDIVDAVKIAKENGANVISITNFKKSPITRYSDVVLLTSGKLDDLSGGSLVEKISQLYVIDVLFMEYINQDENLIENRDLTAMSVSSKKY